MAQNTPKPNRKYRASVFEMLFYLTEDEIKDIFLRTANRVITEKSEIIETCRSAILPLLSAKDPERDKTD